MKNLLKVVPALLMAVVITNLDAQIKPHYIIGLNLSTMTIKNKGLSSHPEMPAGIHFGGFIKIPLSANFDLQSAFLFSAKGTDYKIDTIDYSLSPIYAEVPVLLVYSFGSDIVRVSLFGGPYFALGIGGYRLETGNELRSIRWGSGENCDLRQIDAGLNFGAGVNIKGFLINVQYGYGLVNVSPVTDYNAEMKNKVIAISISMNSRNY